MVTNAMENGRYLTGFLLCLCYQPFGKLPVVKSNIESAVKRMNKKSDVCVDTTFRLEIILYVILSFLLISAVLMIHYSPSVYLAFVGEDGPLEWIATLSLLSTAVICLERLIQNVQMKGRAFKLFYLLATIVFLFGVGEELSWGQRIVQRESSEFFVEHNFQEETNLHNLCLGPLNVNKVIFGSIMGTGIALFLIALPLAYSKSNSVRKIADRIGLPVPRKHQSIGILAVSVCVQIANWPDGWELMELAGSMIFLSIFLFPVNRSVFNISIDNQLESDPGRGRKECCE